MSKLHVSVRLDKAILARIDGLAPAFSTTWHAASRSDVVRALILDGLRVAEQTRAKPRKSAPGPKRKPPPNFADAKKRGTHG